MSTTAAPMPQCPYCGAIPHQHVEQCSQIKSVEYFPDGRIKRVEKHGYYEYSAASTKIDIGTGDA